ncbi:MAG: hypothetical protein ACI9JN_002029 [Bacteroidia bacterium]|jgi:hypothetical protein
MNWRRLITIIICLIGSGISLTVMASNPPERDSKLEIGLNTIQFGYVTWDYNTHQNWSIQPNYGVQYKYHKSETFAFRAGLSYSKSNIQWEHWFEPFSHSNQTIKGYNLQVGIEKSSINRFGTHYIYMDLNQFEGSEITHSVAIPYFGADRIQEVNLYQTGLNFGVGVGIKLHRHFYLNLESQARLFHTYYDTSNQYTKPVYLSLHPISRVALHYKI